MFLSIKHVDALSAPSICMTKHLSAPPKVIVCSATLHSFDVKKLSERIMHFPTWVDLKGEDSVPETVHHVVVPVAPKKDRLWERLGKNHIQVSGLLAQERFHMSPMLRNGFI